MDAATTKVAVEFPAPGAAIDVGLKPTVTPVGAPVADSPTVALNPFIVVVVTVEVPFVPWAALTAFGDAEMVKSAGVVTVRLTVVLWLLPPPVPVMVMG